MSQTVLDTAAIRPDQIRFPDAVAAVEQVVGLAAAAEYASHDGLVGHVCYCFVKS
ncbi:MAG: hypothetical protein ABGZ53_20920 [Fuerstiella sp.]